MKQNTQITLKIVFWFLIGASLGLFFSLSFIYIFFQNVYGNKMYPGITVANVAVGGKTSAQVKNFFDQKNAALAQVPIEITSGGQPIATFSAGQISIGYNSQLLADQAYSLGRSPYFLSNVSLISRSYISGLDLPASYTYDADKLHGLLSTAEAQIKKDPVDALFNFDNRKVTVFRTSMDGADIDWDTLQDQMYKIFIPMVESGHGHPVRIELPIKVIKPKVTTSAANSFGITELVAEGNSEFAHSIPERIHNIQVAAAKLNGVLIPPHTTFSFDDTVGDISAATGYLPAYVIQDNRTVLGDGGGVCQVSTTLFRAALNAGLPIVERHPHDYRVGYYEEDSDPGIDAAINVPSVDLKFMNDMDTSLLIETHIDMDNLKLTFDMYGTRDGRSVSLTKPIVSNQTPPPPTLYMDDPTLPLGQLKQVDFSAAGAHVEFSRTVTKNSKVLYQDTFASNYRPWQAIYLRGTKQ